MQDDSHKANQWTGATPAKQGSLKACDDGPDAPCRLSRSCHLPSTLSTVNTTARSLQRRIHSMNGRQSEGSSAASMRDGLEQEDSSLSLAFPGTDARLIPGSRGKTLDGKALSHLEAVHRSGQPCQWMPGKRSWFCLLSRLHASKHSHRSCTHYIGLKSNSR